MPPKIGRRFSRESARILKQWLSNHEDYPYPSHADKQSLQLLTGLTMTQISNWLANARRRQKAIINRRLSSSDQSPSTVSGRPGTPMPRRKTRDSPSGMNPIQRWVDSPPEDEPAAVGDIARALSSRRTLAQEVIIIWTTLQAHHPSLVKAPQAVQDRQEMVPSQERLQAHKALADLEAHLRHYPSHVNGEEDANWDREHLCSRPEAFTNALSARKPFVQSMTGSDMKSLYIYHLKDGLAHPVALLVSIQRQRKFAAFSAAKLSLYWIILRGTTSMHVKIGFSIDATTSSNTCAFSTMPTESTGPEVKSRCGFCGKSLESFSERADHLSDHFKTGRTMADWTGDWGFEQWVLDSLENYISPYIIEFERSCPFPFEASHRSPSSPRTAYELITLELAFFVQEHLDRTGQIPTNKELQLEACRIVFASEVLSPTSHSPELKAVSWLRDLVTSDPEITQQAKFSPIRSQSESRLSSLQIIGKSTLFDSCPLELQLRGHLYRLWSSSSAAAIDSALQIEACRMVTEMEKSLSSDGFSDIVANWLTKLIIASADWLASFKERARLQWEPNKTQRSNQDSQQMIGDLVDVAKLSKPQYDMILQSNTSLTFPQERPLDTNLEPLAWQAQGLVNPSLLSLDFSSSGQENDETPELIAPFTATSASSSAAAHMTKTAHKFSAPQEWSSSNNQAAWLRSGQFILNNSSSHRWLSSDLKRWVAATMSPSNPDCHVPSDDEIRLQARYLLFGE
ncbi:C2H2 type zinc finger domain-containing protein [Colletotrichum incanum]|nr:C2H2 type zinc finger domain-containing protein [Colletotrichum incanum]